MTAWFLMSVLVVQLLNGRKAARLEYTECSYHQLLERKQDTEQTAGEGLQEDTVCGFVSLTAVVTESLVLQLKYEGNYKFCWLRKVSCQDPK